MIRCNNNCSQFCSSWWWGYWIEVCVSQCTIMIDFWVHTTYQPLISYLRLQLEATFVVLMYFCQIVCDYSKILWWGFHNLVTAEQRTLSSLILFLLRASFEEIIAKNSLNFSKKGQHQISSPHASHQERGLYYLFIVILLDIILNSDEYKSHSHLLCAFNQISWSFGGLTTTHSLSISSIQKMKISKY